MTVIAWDGMTLAADRLAVSYGLCFSVTKLYRVGDCLVGVSGLYSRAGEYLAWLGAGRDPLSYPKQSDGPDTLFMIVVHPTGRIERFEQSGYPIVIEEAVFAGGSGCDFAMAAMACGKSAAEAVELACRLSADCGNGIDTLTFESSE